MKILGAALLLAMAMTLVQPAWAGTGSVDSSNYNTGYGVVTKLFRGIINTVTGWMEIPKQMAVVGQDSGPGPAFTWGFVKGIGYAVGRTVVGAYEIVTFPIPVPEGYRPVMEPDYVISDLPGSEPKR